MTDNPFILDVVANGLRFELTEWPQARASRIYRLPNNERLGLLTALAEFRKENACHRIDRAHLPNNHIISPAFVRPKENRFGQYSTSET